MQPEQVARNRSWFLGATITYFSALVLFLILLLPTFQGPDEPVHYATVQEWAYHEQSPPRQEIPEARHSSSNIQSYSFSEEVTRAGILTQFDEIKWQPTNTQHFNQEQLFGPGENDFLTTQHDRFIRFEPSATSGTWSWYYWLGSHIEQLLENQDFFTRFFALRLLSLLIGIGSIYCAWRVFTLSGLSRFETWLLTILLASQPMLLATAGVVNIDIALIFAFSLFFLSTTHLIQRGFSWPWMGLSILATLSGITAKGPGIVLVVLLGLLLLGLAWRSNIQLLTPKKIFLGLCFILGSTLLLPSGYLSDITRWQQNSLFQSPLVSLWEYSKKSLDPDALSWSHTSYWGNFGWLDTPLPDWTLEIILSLEMLALFGIVAHLRSSVPPLYLPSKKLILWSLLMVVALQLAIRFFDWRVFDATGKILIGTPGRYFLPTLLPFTLILITGLGWFTQNRAQFLALLKWLATGSILLALYSLWHVIIPRYYL